MPTETLPPELDTQNPGAAGAALARRLLASIKDTVASANKSAGDFNDAQSKGGGIATQAMLDAIMNFGGGGAIPLVKGMIVPASRALPFSDFNKAKKALKAGDWPRDVHTTYNAHTSENDDILRSVISDIDSTLTTTAKSALTGKIPAGTTLGDILDHPKFFDKMPEMANIPVTPGWNQHNGATYHPISTETPLGKIELGTAGDMKTLLSVVLHETQHGVQDLAGMKMGGNPEQFIADAKRVSKGVSNASLAITKNLKNPEAKAIAEADFRTLFDLKDKAQASYLNIGGERESRLVQEMHRRGLDEKAFPAYLMDTIPNLQTKTVSSDLYHDLTPDIQKLLDTYAPRVNKKP